MSEKWKPEIGQSYWCVQYTGQSVCFQWMNTEFQQMQFEIGNVFKTQDEAQDAAEKFKAILLSLHAQPTDCNQLPKWCKEGEWGFDPNRFVYFKIKQIDGRIVDVEEQGCNYVHQRQVSAFKHFKQARLRPYNAKEMKWLIGKVIEVEPGQSSLCLRTKGHWAEFLDDCDTDDDRARIIAYDCDMLKYRNTVDGKPCGVLEYLNGNGKWVE